MIQPIELDTEDARAIIEAIELLYSEGLLKSRVYELGIYIIHVYFPDEDRPYWVKEEDWK